MCSVYGENGVTSHIKLSLEVDRQGPVSWRPVFKLLKKMVRGWLEFLLQGPGENHEFSTKKITVYYRIIVPFNMQACVFS